MPELPEVETVVRELRPPLIARTIRAVHTGALPLRRAWIPAWSAEVTGRTIGTVDRRGKWILVGFTGEGAMLLHLGMTGQLTVQAADAAVEDHTHLRFGLDNGNELRFRDIRRFGSADFFPKMAELKEHLDTRLGPEPFDVDPDAFVRALKATVRSLKAVLLDQKVLAGVGNIYADEALFAAGLRPGRRANTLTRRQADDLRQAIAMVLSRAIDQRGSTIRNYVGGSGLKGRFQDEFKVYGRTGQSCASCSTAIVREIRAGRSSHFCPRCQK